jgi:hypothetical protein
MNKIDPGILYTPTQALALAIAYKDCAPPIGLPCLREGQAAHHMSGTDL